MHEEPGANDPRSGGIEVDESDRARDVGVQHQVARLRAAGDNRTLLCARCRFARAAGMFAAGTRPRRRGRGQPCDERKPPAGEPEARPCLGSSKSVHVRYGYMLWKDAMTFEVAWSMRYAVFGVFAVGEHELPQQSS